MTDVFTQADPLYRRAQTVRANPLPLAAGEVAEFPRPGLMGFFVTLAKTAAFFFALGMVCRLMWRITA